MLILHRFLLIFLGIALYVAPSLARSKLIDRGVVEKMRENINLWTDAYYEHYVENLQQISKLINNVTKATLNISIEGDATLDKNDFIDDYLPNSATIRKTKSPIALSDNDTEFERMLQNSTAPPIPLSCATGVLVNASRTIYLCNGISLPYATFQVINGTSGYNCTTFMFSSPACYCPYDFTGFKCELQNPINCNISILQPTPQCTGQDSAYYVYGLNGDPPCHNVYPTDTVRFLVQMTCSNNNSAGNYEGIKNASFAYQAPMPGSIPLNYNFKSLNLNLTYGQQFMLRVEFVKWDIVQNSVFLSFPIDAFSLVGQTVNFTIPVSNFLNTSISGRYYFTLKSIWNGTYAMNNALAYGYLDDATYQEPTAKNTNRLLILVLIIAALLVIGGIICAVWYYRRNKENHPVISRVRVADSNGVEHEHSFLQ
jgi:hypothetical protein